MAQKKVLITGGSHAELPLINAAKKLGFYVISTGNNADGLGHKQADKYVCGDFSDKEFVLELARREQVDNIVSGCNDFAYLSTAYACDKLGITGHDSYETARTIHHKDSFRALTKSLGIRTPAVCSIANREELIAACKEIGFPVVVKPVDLTGGKGIKICQSMAEAEFAYDEACRLTREPNIVVEEYIQGSNHAVSVIIKNRKVIAYFCDNELYFKNEYLVSGACGPSDVPFSAVTWLCADIGKIARELALADGIFHCQFILTEKGVPVMIDPCRRAPGDLYILLASFSTGIDYPSVVVKSECGMDFEAENTPEWRNIARVCVMTDRNGTFHGIECDPFIEEHMVYKIVWAKEGEPIADYMKYKAGIFIFECETPEELYDKFSRFHSLVRIKQE